MDHDGLFKELLRVCFADFIELFLPEVFAYLDVDSIIFVEPESHSAVTAQRRRTADLLIKARFRGRLTYFLIHVEVQSQKKNWSSKRMFEYFAIQVHGAEFPVYPIALLSWNSPRAADPGQFTVEFPDRRVLEFNYAAIQLNRLNWRDYLHRDNPAASALMAKMGVQPHERPKVKAACLRMMARLPLKAQQAEPIQRFIDAYLPLTPAQKTEFRQEVASFAPKERKTVMDYITSWEREGIEIGKREGKLEGKREGKLEATLKLLTWRVGELSRATQKRIGQLPLEQLDQLFDAAFGFAKKAELHAWLRHLQSANGDASGKAAR